MSSYLTGHKRSLNLLLSAHFFSICYSDWLLLLKPSGYLCKCPGVMFKMVPLISEFTIGALVHCCFKTDRFINASTHTPTHTHRAAQTSREAPPTRLSYLRTHLPSSFYLGAVSGTQTRSFGQSWVSGDHRTLPRRSAVMAAWPCRWIESSPGRISPVWVLATTTGAD